MKILQYFKIKVTARVILIATLLLVFVVAPLAYAVSPVVQRSVKTIFYKVGDLQKYPAAVKLAVPYHRQEHSLSCEVATLKMALDYYGLNVKENDLIADLNFDVKDARTKENIWGDPNVGFVGNIDGRIPNNGYGVYEDPIVNLAIKYREAKKITGYSLTEVLQEVSLNHPVIVWGTSASGRNISWQTKDGKHIKAVYGEHTRLIIGFAGTVEKPVSIIMHDPIYGTISMSTKNFLINWALLDNKAVVIY